MIRILINPEGGLGEIGIGVLIGLLIVCDDGVVGKDLVSNTTLFIIAPVYYRALLFGRLGLVHCLSSRKET